MRFNLAQLEALVWVVRLGSVRAAATHLHLTQPAISVRIRELESRVGGQLMQRDSYRASPTPMGREIAAHAVQILAACEELDGHLGRDDELRGQVRIGVADTFAIACLPELMRLIDTRFPGVRAEIRSDFSASLNDALQAGDLDIAVLTAPTPNALITVEPLVELDLMWVASPGLRLGKGPFRPSDLAPLPIITNPNPSGLHTSIAGWFATAGIQPSRINTCNSLVIMATLAREGAGISLLPVSILRADLEERRLVILKVEPSIRGHSLSVAYRRAGRGQGMRALAQMIHEITGRSDLVLYAARPPRARRGPSSSFRRSRSGA